MNRLQPYQAFLLRYWRDQREPRITLQAVWGEQQRPVAFHSLDELVAHLRTLFADDEANDNGDKQ